MPKEIELNISPKYINDIKHIKLLSAKKLRISVEEISTLQIIKKAIDSRKSPVFHLRILCWINENPTEHAFEMRFRKLQANKSVIIVGSGPAGLFAALQLLEFGIKPIILERGKDVRTRRFDLKEIQQNSLVNPDSNYCFGEGGAGTFSDGKLYTRSNKRGNVHRILDILIYHGAPEEIAIDSHPHIGSNILPKVVKNIRNTILEHGGDIHFNSKVTDFIIDSSNIRGVVVNDSIEYLGNSVILATGHSARDIYYLLYEKNAAMEAKSFAMGVRIEHPQLLIDQIQYHAKIRHKNLPASYYNLACQVQNKGVYSFCMCPGGLIIPASTSTNELVLNGMSLSNRNSKFANSGLVVEINENDWVKHKSNGIFAGLDYQKEIEHLAFLAGGKSQTAPAQRITDFVKGKISTSLPDTSYIPGTVSSPLHEIIPNNISDRLRKALLQFGKRMKGYYTEQAQILAAETRTSSPLRILRDRETLMSVNIKGLFPAGEGAGYAGGIVSAAIDGERCAAAANRFLSLSSK